MREESEQEVSKVKLAWGLTKVVGQIAGYIVYDQFNKMRDSFHRVNGGGVVAAESRPPEHNI